MTEYVAIRGVTRDLFVKTSTSIAKVRSFWRGVSCTYHSVGSTVSSVSKMKCRGVSTKSDVSNGAAGESGFKLSGAGMYVSVKSYVINAT